ncbi:ChaN family lipoprotein [Pannus brasiliensis CCIBt3594]|uniref:ChaN family lipoprotein n=1 Tax=Pannus brasiliensis CCIBt3594 TaxID=1427578 RepID=A0AAW9QFL3_9CHRO
MRLSKNLWRLSIGLFLFFLLVPVAWGQITRQTAILDDLARADIVYIGETHDRAEDHAARFQLVQRLQAKNPRVAIAFEMFQRPYQVYLDRYVAGTIEETELREKTEYDDRWGFDWEFYAPLLRFARENKIPLIALNTPAEITRKVAREGLESLTPSEMTYIPPKEEIKTDNEAYRQMIREVYERHSGGNSKGFDRFFLAQVLWDETMADSIAEFHRANPDDQILVLAGKGHIIYGYGIPDRVKRRLGDRVTARSIFLGYDADLWEKGKPAPADYYWQLEK